jgi:hydrogenase maturation protease
MCGTAEAVPFQSSCSSWFIGFMRLPCRCQRGHNKLEKPLNQVKTLVMGLGNVIMGDEGVGVHVVRAVEKHTLPAGVECLDGGTGGFILLEPMQNAARVILIDAAADGNPLGTVTRTTPRFSSDYPPTLTAHDIGIKDLLDAFYIQGGGPEIVLYAITIDPHQSISMDLSPGASQAAEETVERILAEVSNCFERARL